MDFKFLSTTYKTLRGPQGEPQTAVDTISKLADRLEQSTLLSDRRAAILGLKGLSRDCKADVGKLALGQLLASLETDAKDDADCGKALMETLLVLCQVDAPEGTKVARDDIGMKHTDILLSTPQPSHAVISLLHDNNFYLRLSALQLIIILLHNRPQVFQKHFQHSVDGPAAVEALLSDNRDIIRAEVLVMLQILVANNPAIQTSIAFAGAFEKLLGIILQEGGIEGGSTVNESLLVIEGLLKHNVGTQKFFRDLEFHSQLPALLLFPSPPPPPDQPTPQEFSLQFWNAQKITNAGAIVGIISMLISGKGEVNQASNLGGMSRCLLELGLASNAPTSLKAKALRALPHDPPLLNLMTCYVPVPETNGEEWDRLPPEPAIGVLVAYALDGDYGIPNALEVVGPVARRESLELRAAALSVFEAFVSNDLDARLFVLGEMANPPPLPTGSEITRFPFRGFVQVLAETPLAPMTPQGAHRVQIACLLLTCLIRGSEKCKTMARSVIPAKVALPASNLPSVPTYDSNGNLIEKPPLPEADEDNDDDPPQSLLSSLLGSFAISARSRSISREKGEKDLREWDRVLVAYLIVVSAWVWESPLTVKEVLEEGGMLSVLMEPVTQSSGVDVLVQGLCAFVLCACYEFNREAGEITRATLQPIFHKRIGADTFVSRINRIKDDLRFKAIGPDTTVVDVVLEDLGYGEAQGQAGEDATDGEGEVWMDWAFVEFWKNHYYTVQKAITTDPNSTAAESGSNIETQALVASLRSIIAQQASDMERLNSRLNEMVKEREEEREALNAQISTLSERVSELETEVDTAKATTRDVEKEQEDLLVLLEELNTKRRADKVKMREKGIDVSEDEEEEEEGDEEDEEEEE